MSNRKQGKIVSRFKHTCSTSPPSTLWMISTIPITQDHSLPQPYNELPQKLLDPQVPHLFPQEQHTHAHYFIEAAYLHRAPTRTRHNTNPQVRLLKYKDEHLVISTLW